MIKKDKRNNKIYKNKKGVVGGQGNRGNKTLIVRNNAKPA